MGGGRTVWEDYGRWKDSVLPKGEIMAVNDIGSHLHDRLRHWVTLHPEYMPGWMTYRKGHLYGSGDSPMTHSQKLKPGVDVHWQIQNVGGTSGLFACFVGLMLGYTSIVIAGVPISNDGHYFDPPWVRTDFADIATKNTWRWARDNVFLGRVKSLSGLTREWLGEP